MPHRLSRVIKGVLCVLLAAGLLAGAHSAVRADTGSNWTGTYYNNPTLSGTPIFTRIDPALVFNWGPYGPGPGIGGEQWSARWNTVQYLNAGTYRFNVTADDGVRLFIDGQTVVDAWRDQAPTSYYVNVQVVAGTHIIQVDYYQARGDASLSISWDFLGGIATQWAVQYFNNPYLQGSPVVTRYENAINNNWGYGSPDPAVPVDYFSGRWTASLPFAAGTYRFTITVDDGVRLFIDNLPVVDQWQVSTLTTYIIDVPLAAGIHTLRLEYFEWGGEAVMRMDYAIAVGPPPNQNATWYGQYFNNASLQGAPVFTRDDGASGINFNWRRSTPGVGIGFTGYSARWTRRVYFPGHPYTMYLTADDGARLYIDNTLIIDMWRVQAATTVRKNVDLTEGPHDLRLEYFQDQGDAIISLTWDPPNGQNPPQAPAGGGVVTPPGSTGVTATVINADALNVRNGPGTNYDALTAITRDATYPVVGRTSDNTWLQINADGTIGWSNSYYLNVNGSLANVPVANPNGNTNPPPGPTGVRVRTYANMRVRSGPGSSYTLIDNLAYGSDVDVVGRTNDNTWLQVSYGNITGWIYSPYVRLISGSLLNVPITG